MTDWMQVMVNITRDYCTTNGIQLVNAVKDGCAHKHVGWPQHGVQCCLDCGWRRTAAMREEGWEFGPWETGTLEAAKCTD